MIEFAAHNLAEKAHLDCGFSVGDRVLFINDYGAYFTRKIIGFSRDLVAIERGDFIHLDSDAYWSAVSPNQLVLLKLESGAQPQG